MGEEHSRALGKRGPDLLSPDRAHGLVRQGHRHESGPSRGNG